jgi:signal recognition particle GTPase
LYTNGQEALRLKEEQVQKLQQELTLKNAVFENAQDITAELRAQYPSVSSVFLSEGVEVLNDGSKRTLLQLSARTARTLSTQEKVRVENWFKARTKTSAVVVVFENDTGKTTPKVSGQSGR